MSISSTRYYPYAIDNTAGRQTVSDLANDHIQFGVGISSDFKVTGVTTFTGSLTLASSLIDSKGQVGSAGSILASTGSSIDWISPSTTSVDNATKVGTNLNSTDASQWIAFLGASSGNNPIRVDNDLRYNPSTNVLSVKGITLPADDQKITLGDSGDLEIFCTPSTGSNGGSVFKHTGDHDMRFQVPSGAHDIVFEDTSGNNIAVYNANAGCELHWRGASGAGRKFQTTQTGINVTGTATVDGVHLGDNDKITLGNTSDSADLEIFHSTSSGGFSVIRDIGAGQLVIGGSAIEFKSADIATSWAEIDSSGIKINSGKLETTDIEISGTLKDGESTPSAGTAGQVLSSTSTSVKWVNAGELSAGAASQVAISNDNDDAAERFVLFCDSATGNQSIKSDATFKFNPSTNALTANTFIGALSGNASTTTKLATARNIGGVSFDGQSDINLPGVNQAGNQNTSGTAGGLTGTPSISITNLTISGSITDKDSSTGSSGQVLSSTGSQVDWINVGDMSAGSASQVAVSDDSNSNNERFVLFSDSATGNNSVKSDATFKYNPSTNILTTGGFDLDDNNESRFGTNNDLKISHTDDLKDQQDSNSDAVLAGTDWCSFIHENGTGPLIFKSNGGPSSGAYHFYDTSWKPILKLFSGTNARTALYHAGLEKLVTDVGGISITGGIKDKDGNLGSSGQVLSTTGTQLDWVNVGSLAAGSASQVAISDDSNANQSRFVTFVDSATGTMPVKSDGQLKYNPSTNQLTAGSFSGSMAASNVDSGTLGTARIPDLDASKIASGTLGTARIPDLAASKITSGTFADARIPSLAASKITSGTFADARIPSLAASKITSGTFATARIPDLDASKITSGTISDSRLPSSISSDITGNSATATTATTASTVTVAAESTLDGTCSVLFVNDATGNLAPKTHSQLTFSASTGTLTASKLVGNGLNVTNVNANMVDSLHGWQLVRNDQAANADGPLTIGGSTTFDSNTKLQVTNTDAGPNFVLNRNDTSVSANQVIAAIRATGNDSNGTIQETASIEFKADLDHGTNDKPGRIEFRTTSDGGSSATERLSIDSAGNVAVTGNLTVSGNLQGGGQTLIDITNAVKTDRQSRQSTSWIDVTGLSISVTAKSASSKFLIICNVNVAAENSSGHDALVRLMRGTTPIGNGTEGTGVDQRCFGQSGGQVGYYETNSVGITILDSPGAGTHVYHVEFRAGNAGAAYKAWINKRGASATSGFSPSSSITVMEFDR